MFTELVTAVKAAAIGWLGLAGFHGMQKVTNPFHLPAFVNNIWFRLSRVRLKVYHEPFPSSFQQLYHGRRTKFTLSRCNYTPMTYIMFTTMSWFQFAGRRSSSELYCLVIYCLPLQFSRLHRSPYSAHCFKLFINHRRTPVPHVRKRTVKVWKSDL